MRAFFKKYKSPLILLLIIILFVSIVYPQLQLPYFWDELGVYARSSLYLNDHGLSLLPASCPPELSRGHPLLFSFIYGTSFKLFGDTIVTAHITSLIVSLALLVTVYSITTKYFGWEGGMTSATFLLIQPIFIAQSTLVLPEVMLALFMILSIYYWVEKKYLLFILCSSAAILVKETAILVPFVIVVYEGIQVIRKKNSFGIRHFFILIPMLLFGVFLIVQKVQNGWYLFPLHESSINFNPLRFFTYLYNYADFIFVGQLRSFATIFIVFLIGYSIVKRKQIILNPFLSCLLILVAGGIIFSSLNYYMERYTLFIIVAFSIFIGWMSSLLDWNSNPVYGIGFTIIFAAIFFFGKGDSFKYDADNNYQSYIDIHQQAVKYVIDNLDSNDSLFSNFPPVYSLKDSRYGYCDTTAIRFVKISKSEIGSADHFLIADPGSYDHILPDGLVLEKEFSNRFVSFKLFRRQTP